MPSPFDEKRHGVIMMNLAFVMSPRAGDIFQHFRIVTAGPVNEADPDTIMYYGFHPGFEPYYGGHDAIPLYHPYWSEDGVFFQRVAIQDIDAEDLNG